jgi:hypothetical protein
MRLSLREWRQKSASPSGVPHHFAPDVTVCVAMSWDVEMDFLDRCGMVAAQNSQKSVTDSESNLRKDIAA